MPVQQSVWLKGVHLASTLNTNRTVLAGTARVELCAQGSSDLAHLDDGPYEAGGEKEQDPRLIPVPANSYLGRDPSPAQDHSNPLFLSLALSPCAHPSVSVIVSLASWFLSLSSSPLSPFTIFWPFYLAVCTPYSLLLLSLSLVSLPDLLPTGLLFVTNIDSSDPDQLVYKTLDPADRLTGPAGDLTLNSYLGL